VVLSLLHSADAAVRAQATEALGTLGSNTRLGGNTAQTRLRVQQALRNMLTDVSPQVRQRALYVFAVSRVADAATRLTQMVLDDTDFGVRYAAADALVQLPLAQRRRVAPTLLTQLKQQNDRRYVGTPAVAVALGNAGERAVVPDLTEMLNSASITRRAGAVTALGLLGDQTAVAALRPLLKDESHVRLETITALSELGDQSLIAQLLPLPSAEGRHENAELFSAVQALGRLKATAAVPELVTLLQTTTDPFLQSTTIRALAQIKAPRALAVLETQLKRPATSVRAAAARALGHLGQPQAGQALIEALHDTADEVRQAAALALHELDVSLPETQLVSWLRSSDPVLRDAGIKATLFTVAVPSQASFEQVSGDAAIPATLLDALQTLSQDQDPSLRAQALFVLGVAGAPEVATTLRIHLEDEAPLVRLQAVMGLSILGVRTKLVYYIGMFHK